MCHLRTTVLVLSLSLGPGLSAARGTEYVVAPAGSDTHPGTAAAPFRSIQQGADVAQAGDTVLVRAGTYRETVVVPRSGTAEGPIRFAAWPGETVVISAADPVGGWTHTSRDRWQAQVDWDAGPGGVGNTLFIDGVLHFEARQGAEDDPLAFDRWGQIPRGGLTSTGFTAPDLAGWGDGFWNGAWVRHHRNDWTILTSTIADYDSQTGRVTFAQPIGTVSQKHVLGYTIGGTLKALDRPGEWYKDRSSGTLYLQLAANDTPRRHQIEFKRRAYVFDLRGRRYIHVEGFVMRGGTIETDNGTAHNRWARNRIYAYDKGGIGRARIAGEANVFRDNEVLQSWGSVATVSGRDHRIVNNDLHDIGYGGTTRVLSMSGTGHLVSHNTVRKIARSFLDGFPTRSEFKYNLFEDGGRLSWDTGFFDGDSGRGNGYGCVIHHNVFRNTHPVGIYMALYSGLDLVIHHNLIYDVSPFTLRAGPQNFLKYFHNTVIGPAPLASAVAHEAPVSANYNNNLQITSDKFAALGVDCRGNHDYTAADFVDLAGRDLRLAAGSGAIDAGVVLPRINDGYSGAAPDAGALEYGEGLWPVGHDFNDPPEPAYTWEALPGTNRCDDSLFSSPPDAWTLTGTPAWIPGNAWNTGGVGLSRSGDHCIRFRPGDGMRRTFGGLRPETAYVVGLEARLVDHVADLEGYAQVSAPVRVARHRGEDYITRLADGQWLVTTAVDFQGEGTYNRMELTYTRPPGSDKATDPDARLEVRLDTPDGPRLGTFTYNPGVIDSWYVARIDLPPTSGRHPLTLIGRGVGAARLYLANLRLLHTRPPSDARMRLTLRGYGGPDRTTRVGDPFWRWSYETLPFRTGPGAEAVELVLRNDGPYEAYVDRLALYEVDNPAEVIVPAQVQRAPDRWLLDLGRAQDLHALQLQAAGRGSGPAQLRVTALDDGIGRGRTRCWQQDLLTAGPLAAGAVFVVKPTDPSDETGLPFQRARARYVQVERLDGRPLGLAEVTVERFDEMNRVASDADVTRGSGFWQAAFTQIVNIGRLTWVHGTGRRAAPDGWHVAVWDRLPARGGRILWQQTCRPGEMPTSGDRFVLNGDARGDDGRTRLASVLGRVVRIEPATAGAELSLAGVTLYDTVDAPPVTNRAQFGTASQSSNHYAHDGLAEVAINGVVLPRDDFTTTQATAGAWWQVDLGQTPRIDQIVIFNREDVAERVGRFRVSVWDGAPRSGGHELWGRDYAYAQGDLPAGGSLTINGEATAGGRRLDAVPNARVVRVQLHGTNLLSLVEVQVWTRDS